MSRGVQRPRFIWVLAAVSAAVLCLTGPALAKRGVARYDDRPPLLAAEEVPSGEPAAGWIRDLQVVSVDPQGRAEILLHADGSIPYEVFELSGPDRLVFDLPGMRAPETLGRVEVADEGVVRVRVAQYRDAPDLIARVVFDLTGPFQWSAAREGNSLRLNLTPTSVALLGTPGSAPVPVVAEATILPDAQEAEAATDTIETVETAALDAPAFAPVVIETADTEQDTPPAQEIDQIAALIERPAPVTASTEGYRPEPEPASLNSVAVATVEPQQEEPAPWTEPEIADVIEEAAGLTADTITEEATPVTYVSQRASSGVTPLPSTERNTIQDIRRSFSGQPISTNLVDADIKQVFSLFHEISGLNFVLDPSVKGSVTIVVDSVPWDQALDLILKNNGLDMVMEGNVVRIAPVSKLAKEAQARKALHEAKELEAPPITITRTLSYAKAKDVEKVIRDAIVSSKGRVIVDERTNTLIIRDIPARVDATDALLTTLDAETPQVMIEARIVEVSRDFVQDLGIQWGASAIAEPALGTQTSLDFPHRARVDYDLNLPRAPAANALGFSFGNVLDSFTLDITIDALETEGYARRLSSPKIATQNNEAAEIEQGVRIPIVSTTATEIDVRFVSASLRLKVTPQITAEGTVILEVEVENNSPDFVNTVGDVPAINTQRAQTKVLIGDNGTTVIGGIFTVNEGKSESGVPFFRNIPGLGWLFRSRNVQSRNRELLIFITPRIIKAS
ncbi:MAG: type IV pilus secretin PilQ [Acidobacteriota bacterium]|nr:type IV pilus secretin PilQ [Acidobacteriota bacterium]